MRATHPTALSLNRVSFITPWRFHQITMATETKKKKTTIAKTNTIVFSTIASVIYQRFASSCTLDLTSLSPTPVAGCFCLLVASICQVMLSPNGSEHVLSSCGAQNDAKEHLELGHCIDEPIVHDDKSLGRRNGRMRFSDFHGILHELYD
ncbi:hypothetical protein RHGRI_028958 [Rhododendron griersonianum]|uniref:Uncharacterized protein n=1 Tax=Rhododendron griersonianum TaxID=479676 RepID=A0AAV6IHQ6_9ERIC|nr:hypothetical protein RHGRI_028958 [Rhododendron griersonianum]